MTTWTKVILTIIIGFVLCAITIDKYTQYLHRVQDIQIEQKYELIISEADSAIHEVDVQIQTNIDKDHLDFKTIDSLKKQVEIERVKEQYRLHKLIEANKEVTKQKEQLSSLSKKIKSEHSKIAEFEAKLKKFKERKQRDSVIYNYDTLTVIMIDTLIIDDEDDVKSIKRKYFK